MFASTRLIINCATFALIATAVSIRVQDFVVRTCCGSFAILASVFVGGGVGLVIKYILDKRYIFRFRMCSIVHNTLTFALYPVMGLVTTMIFWSFGFSFHHIFEIKEMRYFGGVIGLLLGYLTKSHLDKRYAFEAEAE